MSFKAPNYSSSPAPSTPDRRSAYSSKRSDFGASNNPTTTPAGPPPSSANSYTPAGLPPSSVFGSSVADSRYGRQPISSLKFTSKTPLKSSTYSSRSNDATPEIKLFGRPAPGPKKSGLSSFSVPVEISSDEEEDADQQDTLENAQEDDYEMDEDEEVARAADKYFGGSNYDLEDIDRMVDDMRDDEYSDDDRDLPAFNSPAPKINGDRFNRSQAELLMSTHSLGRSRNGGGGTDLTHSTGISRTQPPNDSMYGSVAKGIYTNLGTPRVSEKDEIILGTEERITRLYKEGLSSLDDQDALNQALSTIPRELSRFWNEHSILDQKHLAGEYKTAIGPGLRADKFAQANFLATLMLPLHHPGSRDATQNEAQNARGTLMRLSASIHAQSYGKPKTIPAILIEWLDEFHDPYAAQLEDVNVHKPNPVSHRLFWETMLNSLVRGRVTTTVGLLSAAGWKYARIDRDGAGYSGVALVNIEKVTYDALQVLQQCPGTKGDWNTKSSDWTLFRLRASQALDNLKKFAEGRDRGRPTAPSFEASNFGLSTMPNAQSYSGLAKKAESQVPWSIYQHLLSLYNIVLGDTTAIIGNGLDWVEATIGSLVWWNPSKEDRHLSLRRSKFISDDENTILYMAKLAECFYAATAEDTDFKVNILSPSEVGVACIFESDTEAVIGIMRSHSGPISSAVAEIASLGGWLPPAEPQSLIAMDSLDQDDMDVLGLDAITNKLEDVKDYTLIVYAEGLATRGQISVPARFDRPEIVKEGWELAIEVLGRLDSAQNSEEEVSLILKDLPLDSSDTVDRLWILLNKVGMVEHAQRTAEEYGDLLAEQTHKYGEALWYYALAHRSEKVKDVLNLLISFSLIHSTAFPPQSDLDDHLQKLISSPRNALAELARMDFDAGNLLYKLLSGYATLRKFYDIRDASPASPSQSADAATALLAVLSSADDNIRGGLYDESRGAVVNVDFLLALFGESLVFVNQPASHLTGPQIDTLLKALEDLQSVPTRIYTACNEFFQTVVASTPGLPGSNPMDLLKKSTSNASGSETFSLVGSSMLASQLHRSMGSGVLVKVAGERGWDWRKGLKADVEGTEVVRLLRYGLAKDLARVWVEEVDGMAA